MLPSLAQPAQGAGRTRTRISYPLTITNCGQTLTFARAPRRVITTTEYQMEILFRLGLGDRIVATYFNFGTPVATDLQARVNRVRVIGGNSYPSKEVVLSLRPDFVYSNLFKGDFGQGAAPTLRELRQSGAQVYGNVFACDTPARASFDDLYTEIRQIGRIFDVPDRAERTITTLEARVAAVEARVKGRPHPKLLVFDNDAQGGTFYVASGPLFRVATHLAGGALLFGDTANLGPLSKERIAASNPDALAVFIYPPALARPVAARAREIFALSPSSPAARHNRYFGLQPYEGGLGSVTLVEDLARGLHPEVFR